MAAATLTTALRAVNEGQRQLKEYGDSVKTIGDKAEDAGRRGNSAMGGLGKSLLDVGKIAGGFVLAQGLLKAPGLFMDMSKQAASLELSMKKVATVFGEDLAGDVKDWADQSALAMGLTSREAQGLAAGLADLLVPMGMTREAAFDMSTTTIGLAGALSEWSAGSKTAAEVSDILTKAYLGETDGLKALGISISAADVTARLATKGQKELTGAAQQQAQALAIQELVFEKSTDAQKAFAEGAGTVARRQAEASATIRQWKEDIVTGFQPVIASVTQYIATTVIPTVDQFIEWVGPKLSAAIDIVEPKLRAVGSFAWDALKAAGEFIRDVAAPAARALWEKLEPVGKFLEKGFEFTWGALKDAYEFIRDVAVPAVKDLAEKGLDKVREKLSAIDWKPMTDALSKTRDYLADISKEDIGGWWDAFAKKMKPAIDFLKPFVEDLLDAWLDQFRALKPAFEDLAKALEPFMPLLKPIAEIIGVTLVLAIAAALQAMEMFIRFNTGVFIASIKVVELALIALWKTWEIGVTIWDKVTAGFEKGLEVFKKAWDDPIGFLAGMMTQIFNIAKSIGSAILNGMKQGIEDGWEAFKGWVTGKLDPRNWDIPGLSPFLAAYEHAGQMGGRQLMRGVVGGITEAGGAPGRALSGTMRGVTRPGGFNVDDLQQTWNGATAASMGMTPLQWLQFQAFEASRLDSIESPWGSIPYNPYGPRGGGGSFAGGGGDQTVIIQIDGAEVGRAVIRQMGRGYA